MMTRKYCIVPRCGNTIIRTPNKRFVTVPLNEKRRHAWLKAIRIKNKSYSPKGYICVCEDHFNLKEDAENWMKVRFKNTERIVIKKSVVPHIFECQTDRTHDVIKIEPKEEDDVTEDVVGIHCDVSIVKEEIGGAPNFADVIKIEPKDGDDVTEDVVAINCDVSIVKEEIGGAPNFADVIKIEPNEGDDVTEDVVAIHCNVSIVKEEIDDALDGCDWKCGSSASVETLADGIKIEPKEEDGGIEDDAGSHCDVSIVKEEIDDALDSYERECGPSTSVDPLADNGKNRTQLTARVFDGSDTALIEKTSPPSEYVHPPADEVEKASRGHHCPHCNYSTTRKYDFYRHLSKVHAQSSSTSVYAQSSSTSLDERKTCKCPYCHFVTYTSIRLHHHISQNHGQHKCFRCQYVTPCKVKWKAHLFLEHHVSLDIPYKCRHCEYKTVHKLNFQAHVDTKHSEDVEMAETVAEPGKEDSNSDVSYGFKCVQCRYVATSEANLSSHLLGWHGVNLKAPYKCTLCGYATVQKYNIPVHLAKEHNIF